MKVFCFVLLTSLVGSLATNNTSVVSPCSSTDVNPPSPDWVNYGGFIILIVAVIAMFWGLALVCEDYFVPALSVFCEEWKVPKDVGGATVMAAGASSPELFTALIGLLVYGSNIGLGTVIGSEIFNHMIISAGSVLFAKNGVLTLDIRMILRDLIAYVVSLIFFVYTLMPDDRLHGSVTNMFHTESWSECLSLSTLKSGELLILYLVYAVICGNFQRLTSLICPRAIDAASDVDHPIQSVYDDIECLKTKPNVFKIELPVDVQEQRDRSVADALYHVPQNQDLTDVDAAEVDLDVGHDHKSADSGHLSPMVAFRASGHSQSFMLLTSDDGHTLIDALKMHEQKQLKVSHFDRDDPVNGDVALQNVSDKESGRHSSYESGRFEPSGDIVIQEDVEAHLASVVSPVPSPTKRTKMADLTQPVDRTTWIVMQLHDAWLWITDTVPPANLSTVDASDESLSCYLYVYSDMIGLDALPKFYQWTLRYYTVDENGFHSVSNEEAVHHHEKCEIFDLALVTEVKVISTKKLKFSVVFEDATMRPVEFTAPSLGVLKMVVERLTQVIGSYHTLDKEHRYAKAAAAEVALWTDGFHQKHVAHDLLEVPRGRYARWWHYTVLVLKVLFKYTLVDCRVPENRRYYGRIIASSTIWMAVLSYIMIVCCNFIGSWIGASPLIMGLTVAAVGTSFPNLISSMIVAKQGYGDMAICNCLGSNIFNVNIALGLPYFLLMLIRQGRPYEAIQNGGIVMQVFLLIVVVVVWIICIAIAGFKMKSWMAWMYIVIYFVVLGIAIGI